MLYSELVERRRRRRVHQLVAECEDVSPGVVVALGVLVGEQADGPCDDGEGGGVDGEGAQEGRGEASGEGGQALLGDAHLDAVYDALVFIDATYTITLAEKEGRLTKMKGRPILK